MSNNLRARAWVDLSATALFRNASAIRALVGPDVHLIPMVKANAYGLGVQGAVRALAPAEPWAWGVATADEGAELRALGVEDRIVVFSPLPPQATATAIEADVEVGISSVESLRALVEASALAGKSARFHLEVDTGIARAGFDGREVDRWRDDFLAAADGCTWVGCYTHLHSADEAPGTVAVQHALFRDTLRALPVPEDAVLHVLNSAGAVHVPDFAEAAVRPGIFLYGGCVGEGGVVPEPVAALRARVVHIRDAKPGDAVGYGETYRAGRPERWATLAIGYGDGLPRALGNRGRALLAGTSVPIVGRISMDVTVVDVTGISDVALGDVATLLGSDGAECITVDEIASQAGTISYEVLTGLTSRLPRIWGSDDGR